MTARTVPPVAWSNTIDLDGFRQPTGKPLSEGSAHYAELASELGGGTGSPQLSRVRSHSSRQSATSTSGACRPSRSAEAWRSSTRVAVNDSGRRPHRAPRRVNQCGTAPGRGAGGGRAVHRRARRLRRGRRQDVAASLRDQLLPASEIPGFKSERKFDYDNPIDFAHEGLLLPEATPLSQAVDAFENAGFEAGVGERCAVPSPISQLQAARG